MAGFYSGADSTTPPLHWPTIAPEFTNLIARNKGRFTISDAPGGGARMIVDLPQFRADRAR
jgi:hypothetical protein